MVLLKYFSKYSIEYSFGIGNCFFFFLRMLPEILSVTFPNKCNLTQRLIEERFKFPMEFMQEVWSSMNSIGNFNQDS